MDYSLKKFLRFPFSPKYLPYILLVLAFLGFLDATYLTILHYKNVIPPCTLSGCETVLTSQFATFFGLPIALIGAGFYGILMVLGGFLLQIRVIASEAKQSNPDEIATSQAPRNDRTIRRTKTALFVLSALGLLVGLFLVYLQAFVLHAFCQYCLLSEVIDFLLFDTCWWIITT